MDLFILKTDGEKFASANEKTLHLIFNADALIQRFIQGLDCNVMGLLYADG